MTNADEMLRQYASNNPQLIKLNPALFSFRSSPADVQEPKRRHKYNAQPTEIDGIRFDSKREAQRYQELQMLAAAGEIRKLELQPRFELQPSFTDAHGKKHRAINYVADFQYYQNGHRIVEDVKGVETAVFKIKRKLFLYKYGRQVVLRIVK